MALVFPLRRGAIIYQVINNTVGVCVSSTCCCVFFCFYFHAVHTNRYTHLRAQQTTAEKICFKSPHVAAGFVRPCTHSQLTRRCRVITPSGLLFAADSVTFGTGLLLFVWSLDPFISALDLNQPSPFTFRDSLSRASSFATGPG